MDTFDLVLIILLIIILLYLYIDRKFSYWARRNVPYEPPASWIFGSAKELFFEKENTGIVYDNIYRKFEGKPYCGFYEFYNPVLLIRDPQFINMVMVEKFNSFQISKFVKAINPKANELFSLNPFILDSESGWKETRSKVASGITTNKLKVLESMIKPIFKNITDYVDNSTSDIDTFELCTKFSGDLVANFGWGISTEGLAQKSVKNVLDSNMFIGNKSLVIKHLLPSVSYWMKLRFQTQEFCDLLKDITSQAIQAAESSKSNQTTFLQNLLNTRDKLRQNGGDMSLLEISAHMNTFFIDAYETVGRVTSLVIQYLMLYPDVQQRLREEINEVTKEITIELVNKLQYMEMVFSEVVRIFPILTNYSRVCTEKCKLGSLDVDVGTYVTIPAYSIHHDPKYYPNPEVFNPENFSEENKRKRPKFTHFIFGHGPRMCPGMKYATTTLKLFIYYLLKEYEILPPTDHPVNTVQYDPKSIMFLVPKGEFYVKFQKLS